MTSGNSWNIDPYRNYLLDGRMKSPPVKVIWAGFESGTYSLQRGGWQLSANEDFHSYTVTIAMKHPHFKLYAVTSTLKREVILSRASVYFEVEAMAHDITYQSDSMEPIYYKSFHPIDATPRVAQNVEFVMHRMSESDCMFHPVNVDAKEVYLREATMEEILKFALEKQEPMQRVIREKRLDEAKRLSKCRAELRLVA